MDKFSFTWGIPEVEELGYVQVFNFMLHCYTDLGITRSEMLLIIHLASYKFNSERGQSRPSLQTVATHMGYKRRATVTELVRSLEEKGMLKVYRRDGETSIYDASPFAFEAIQAWNRTLTVERKGDAENDTLTVQRKGTLTVQRKGVLRSTVTEEEEEEEESKNTKLPQRSADATAVRELEYEELGPDGNPIFSEDKAEAGWMIAELPIHRLVLDTCHAKRFRKTRQKSRLTGLSQAIKAGDVLGDKVYQKCLDELDKVDSRFVGEPLPPIPRTWLTYRLGHAANHRWGVAGTIDALFDRDALAKHCMYHLKGTPVEVKLEVDPVVAERTTYL